MAQRDMVVRVLAELAAGDAHTQWSMVTAFNSLDDVRVKLRRVARQPSLPSVLNLHAPADRLPLVVGHGPSIDAVLPALLTGRDRFWIIAPYRSALILAARGLVADVVVLAERDTWPVDDTVSRWQALDAPLRDRVRDAALVADAFAPVEVVHGFARAYGFDSGLGLGVPLPFNGLTVLSCLAVPLLAGHRRLTIAGVDLTSSAPGATALREACDRLEAVGVDWVAPGATVGPTFAPMRLASRCESAEPDVVRAALQKGQAELRVLSDVLQRVREGMAMVSAEDDLSAIKALRGLVGDLGDQWRREPAIRAAVSRGEAAWVTTLWALSEARPGMALASDRSLRMLAGVVLPELAGVLSAHIDACREVLLDSLTSAGEATFA